VVLERVVDDLEMRPWHGIALGVEGEAGARLLRQRADDADLALQTKRALPYVAGK
jgi:hypothetical protein